MDWAVQAIWRRRHRYHLDWRCVRRAILAVIFTVFFAIWTAIIQWVAKMFHGQGTNDQMAYAFSAILAPFAVISGVVTLLAAIPYVGYCFSALLLIAGIYVLFSI